MLKLCIGLSFVSEAVLVKNHLIYRMMNDKIVPKYAIYLEKPGLTGVAEGIKHKIHYCTYW